MKARCVALLAVLLAACEQAPTPEVEPPFDPPQALARATPSITASVPLESLPRAIAGVSLGAPLPEVETRLGKLACHDNPQRFRVCTPTSGPPDTPRKLEVYFVHDQVASLAYEQEVGANVWDFLNGATARFGRPSVNGANERDRYGRVHEIYGWKDERSLYSIRFVWDTDSADRSLTSTAVTLWDRKAYQTWEAEQKAAKERT
jgi:hypothetical protein